jgi:hypothetical protein
MNSKDIGVKNFNRPSVPDASKKALHFCLRRLKIAKDQTEIERLTEELHRIVFRKQYQTAED